MPLFTKAFAHLKSITTIYLLGLLFFSLFRLLLVFTNLPIVEDIGTGRNILLARALLMGLRFDTVISGYILGLPIVVLSVFFVAGSVRPWLLKSIYIYIGIFYVLCFLMCSIDIPFFNYFFNRLNDTVFNWSHHASFSLLMIVEAPRFMVYLLFFLVVCVSYLLLLKKIFKKHNRVLPPKTNSISWRDLSMLLPLILLVWAVTFLGIRGRMSEKSPIIAGTAFFSNNAFINQLGLNPVFSLMRSVLDDMQPENEHFHKMDDALAISRISEVLHADKSLMDISSIARRALSSAPLQGRNVIVVIMESMSAAKMKRYGNADGLTPFLDSLAAECWAFDNIYSAGLHTYNGIYSTLFAHPAIMHQHSMEKIAVPEMAGFSNVLRKRDYQTIFFTTHDELFDNMSGFLSSNNFEQIIGQKDYPEAEVRSTLGVPDEYMFRYSIQHLTRLSEKHKPFFAAYMTGSDHDPIVVPLETGFIPRHPNDEKQNVVAYADWSLQKFMEYASVQPWFQNTVFVFVADHGVLMGHNSYDIVFSNHHIPFLIFAPGFTKGKSIASLGLQTDVFPTVMSLVTPAYINNTFGINLLEERRTYIVFSADDKIACMNDSLLYVYRTNIPASLYKYRHNSTADYAAIQPQDVMTMKELSFAWLQTSEWMLAHSKTRLQREGKYLLKNKGRDVTIH